MVTITTKINEQYSKGLYNDVPVIIMNKNKYVNASKYCTIFNKELKRYFELPRCKDKMINIEKKCNIKQSTLTIMIRKNVHTKLHGKYVHLLLLKDIIRWIQSSKEKIIQNQFVYIVTSDLLKCVKIGYWRSSKKALKSRYKHTYGDELELLTITVDDCIDVEKMFKKKFTEYRISGELYEKKYYDKYKKYFLSFKL